MRRCCLLLVCLLLLTGCGRADTQDVSSFAPAEGDRLVIFTSHKETIYEPILKEFEQRTGIWVELETGGTVTLLERIAAGESGADLMFGGGADSLSAYSACFAPYVSEYAGDVAPEYDTESYLVAWNGDAGEIMQTITRREWNDETGDFVPVPGSETYYGYPFTTMNRHAVFSAFPCPY